MEKQKYVCNCKTCSDEFLSDSPWRRFCDKCRKQRRLEHVREYRKKSKVYKCDKVIYKARENLDELIQKAREKKLRYVREDIDCPNYDPTRTDCACCASDSWKFKDCGEKK